MKIKLPGGAIAKDNKVPGPGNYEVAKQAPAIQNAAPRFGFGSSTRNAKKETTKVPGPGAYKINSTIGDIPEYAMPNRDATYKYV